MISFGKKNNVATIVSSVKGLDANGRVHGVVDVTEFGAKGDGVTDDTVAIQNAINNCPTGGTVKISNGTYGMGSELILKDNIIFDMGAATLKALNSIPTMITSDLNTRIARLTIKGGKLDCNGLAQIGIHLKNYKDNILIEDINIENPALIHLKLGDSTAPYSSYQAVVNNVVGDRQRPTPQPIGSIGLLLEKATDNSFNRCVFVGVETGVKMISGASGNNFFNTHVWSRLPENVITDGFVIESTDNFFTNCIADTVQRYGFHVKNWRNIFTGCKIFNNTQGSNNIVVGFRLNDASSHVTILNSIFSGSSTARINKDIEFENPINISNNNYTIQGSVWTYCNTSVATLPKGLIYPDSTINLELPFIRGSNVYWQLRCDTNNDFTITERNTDGTWKRDVVRFNRTNGLTTFGGDGLIIPKVAALPTASSTYRGCIVRIEGGAGVADAEYICKKIADNSYSWKLINLT